MIKYVDLQSFDGKFHFIGSSFRISVSLNDQKTIFPLSKEYCFQMWKYWIHPTIKHIMLMNVKWNLLKLIIPDCGCGDLLKEEKTRKKLFKILQIDKMEKITFFWNSESGVETTWEIFLKYWSNFCFTGAAGGIIIFHTDPRILVYSDETTPDMMWIGDRKQIFNLN